MIERAHHKALFIMGAIALLPSLLSVGYWLGWQSAMLLLLICPVLLMLNIWIQKSPEETCSEQITKFRCIRRCYTSNARFEFLNIA